MNMGIGKAQSLELAGRGVGKGVESLASEFKVVPGEVTPLRNKLLDVAEAGPMKMRLLEWISGRADLYTGVLESLISIAEASDNGTKVKQNDIHYVRIFPDEIANPRTYMEELLSGSGIRLVSVANKYSFKPREASRAIFPEKYKTYPLKPLCETVIEKTREDCSFNISDMGEHQLFNLLSYLAYSTDKGIRLKMQTLKKTYGLEDGWLDDLKQLAERCGMRILTRARYHLSLEVIAVPVAEDTPELPIEEDDLYTGVFAY
jgi:hypothetical protein